MLLVAVACGVVSMGVVSAWLVTAYRFPGSRSARVGAASAARDAGLRDGLRLYRLAAVQRTGAVGTARAYRLAGARVLVSRGALARRRGGDAFVRALSLRLSHRAHRVPGSVAQRDRGRAAGGLRRRRRVPARRRAARAPGHRRRRHARADGDAGRLRHRVVFRRRGVHHRHLQDLVFAGRQHRGGAALRLPARLRRGAARARAREPRPRRVLRHGAAQGARPSPARRPRRHRLRRLRGTGVLRLRAAGAAPRRPGLRRKDCRGPPDFAGGEQLRRRRGHGADRRRHRAGDGIRGTPHAQPAGSRGEPPRRPGICRARAR